MNERIRELQKQSSIEQWDYDNGCYRYVLNPEKFAELIVRECILTIQMGITRDGHDTEKYQRSMKHIRQIKQHFGVLE